MPNPIPIGRWYLLKCPLHGMWGIRSGCKKGGQGVDGEVDRGVAGTPPGLVLRGSTSTSCHSDQYVHISYPTWSCSVTQWFQWTQKKFCLCHIYFQNQHYHMQHKEQSFIVEDIHTYMQVTKMKHKGRLPPSMIDHKIRKYTRSQV